MRQCPAAASPDHDIPLRQPPLELDASIPRYWMNESAFATHVLSSEQDHLALARRRAGEVLPRFAA